MLVTDLAGRVPDEDPLGLFVDNTRLLSRLEVTVNDKAPRSISASPVGGDGFLAYDELVEADGVPEKAVYLETVRFIGDGMRTILRLSSFAADAVTGELAIHLAADFADAQEAEQRKRQQTAEVETAWDGAAGELTFRYLHPQLDRGVNKDNAERSPAAARRRRRPTDFPGTRASWLGGSGAGRRADRRREADGLHAAPRVRRAGGAARAVAWSLARRCHASAARNATVVRAWETATRDLASLPYGLADGPAMPSAGLPLYLQFFGRDALTIGWQALMATRRPLHDSLDANAAWRGRRIDDWLDEGRER